MNRTRSLVFFSLVAVAGLAGCTRHSSSTERPLVPVKVQTVESGAGGTSTRYSAAVLPAVQVEVAYKVTGYVDSLAQVRMPDERADDIRGADSGHHALAIGQVRGIDRWRARDARPGCGRPGHATPTLLRVRRKLASRPGRVGYDR